MSVDIALIDSGVNSGHFHVGWVAGGTAFSLGPNGDVRESMDYTDAIGHGTAVAAVIRERCPGARIHAVKIFTDSLRAPVSLLIHGLEWVIDRNMKIIHLSLGTEAFEGRDRVVELCRTACVRRLVVLAAARSPDDEVYPSCLDTVIGVYWHPECGADDLIYDPSHPIPFGASGYPRPLPGVPPESNFRGPSFAVARVTARVACLLEQNPDADPNWVREKLREMGARAGVSPNRRVPGTQESL